MKHYVRLLILFVLLAIGCSSPQNEQRSLSGKLEITKSQARPAAQGANSAAYFTIYNGTANADTLLGVASDEAEDAGVHESYVTEGGLSGMRPAENLAIPSGDSLLLQPGGFHVMLMELKRKFVIGDSIQLQIQFAKAGSRSIFASVKQ